MEPWLSVIIGPLYVYYRHRAGGLLSPSSWRGGNGGTNFFLSTGCPAGGSLAVRRMSGRGLTRLCHRSGHVPGWPDAGSASGWRGPGGPGVAFEPRSKPMNRTCKHKFRPGCEDLEGRQLLSSASTVLRVTPTLSGAQNGAKTKPQITIPNYQSPKLHAAFVVQDSGVPGFLYEAAVASVD